MEVNWMDPKARISKYFTVKEALWLPRWQTMHVPSDSERENILALGAVMDKVREALGGSVSVHCWIRPVLNQPGHPNHGQDYNALVGGAKASAHRTGRAVDFHAASMDCDQARSVLEPMLEDLGLRMEQMPGGSWVHLDTMPPNPNRFFKP